MSFSKQEKLNASNRMQTLFNAINNEIKSSLHYTGSMQKGNRNRISYDENRSFDVDADILLRLDVNRVNAQIAYGEIIKIIKRCIRHPESIKLKSARGSNNAIIHIKSQTAPYTFDIAIKTSKGYVMRYDKDRNIFYWK